MRMRLQLGSVLVVLIATMSASARAQESLPAPTPIALSDYLARVGRANLELAAQRANIPIAEAQIVLARVFPDPTLTAGLASWDVSGQDAPNATTLGVSATLELGGKRAARVRAAESAKSLAQAEVEDFFRVLRASAATSFIDAAAARLELDQKRRSLASLDRLVSVNQERVRAGDIGEMALAKTRVEAQQFKSDVLQAEGELAAAELGLSLSIGGPEAAGMLPEPQTDLKIPAREFSPEQLIAIGLKQRPDVIARKLAARSAEANVALARANRWIDLGVGVAWQHNLPGAGRFAQPHYEALTATVTVPLPFSRMYPGELQGALATQTQSELWVGSAELRVRIEVQAALARYRAAVERVRLYSSGTVADAERVFESTMYNYQRGGASLLEVLDAQRTLNEVYLSYFDALRAHGRALVEVHTAAGTWDLDF